MRLIDADALKRRIIHKLAISDALYMLPGEKAIYEEIEKTPSIDAVQVVRCKDCKWRETACTIFTPDNWFCPKGERKES